MISNTIISSCTIFPPPEVVPWAGEQLDAVGPPKRSSGAPGLYIFVGLERTAIVEGEKYRDEVHLGIAALEAQPFSRVSGKVSDAQDAWS
jgi:hypothetical protein